MTQSLRRSALRKSSIGIESIRKSITNLSEGLVSIGKQSTELLKETRKSNLLKRRLIRQDSEFFRKRRENVLRKQREDELEASTITGATKRQGNIITNSTRGFLGRMLDFLGTLIVGWALVNLPKIIKAFQVLFGFIKRVVGIFTGFIQGMQNFFEGLGTGIDNFLNVFKRFDFREDDKKIKDTFEKTEQNLVKINKDFTESVRSFALDKDINNAGKVAEDLGINDELGEAIAERRDEIIGIGANSGGEIEGREDGGKVEKDVPVVVGEGGEEIFVPDTAGTIIPNQMAELLIASANLLEGGVEGQQILPDETFLSFDDENIEGMNTMDDGSSIIPDEQQEGTDEDDFVTELNKSSGGGGSSVSGMASAGGELKDDNKGVKGIKKSMEVSIEPIMKKFGNLKGLKRPKTTVIMNNSNIQNPPQVAQGMNNKSNKNIISFKVPSSIETLLKFQNVSLSIG